MRVVLEDYGHYATGRKPREGEDALLVLDEFSRPRLGGGLGHQPGRAGPRRRRPGRGRRPIGRRPGRPPPGPPAAGLLCRRDRGPPVPGPRAAAGPGRDGPDPGAQLGAGLLRPPGAAPRPGWGSGPASTPRPVRQAQPGEAWVIQAGQSIHLRVLPPPAVAPEPVEPTATLPLADDTIPLPRSSSRPRSGSPPPSPWPAEPSAGSASGSAGGGSGPGGCPPRPGGRGWSGGPCRVGGGDESPARTGLPASPPCGDPRPHTARPVACWTGCHLAAARVKGAVSLRVLASLRDRLRRPLTRPSSRRPGETRSPGAGEEQRPTSRQEEDVMRQFEQDWLEPGSRWPDPALPAPPAPADPGRRPRPRR